MDWIHLVQDNGWLADSGLLWTQSWAFGYHKKPESSWLRERPSASQGGFYPMEFSADNTDDGDDDDAAFLLPGLVVG